MADPHPRFSPLLIRPIHPIHGDVCEDLAYKVLGLLGVLPAAVLLGVAFDADLSGVELASVQTVAPQAATDVVVGLGVIAYGMTRLGVTLSPLDVALFLVMLLAGLAIVYSFLLLLATCAFWFVKLENVLVIFQALFGKRRALAGNHLSALAASVPYLRCARPSR